MATTLANAIMRDVFANRPAAGSPGRLFAASDTNVLYRDNGASWDIVLSALTNPMTTLGDIIYGGAAGASTRLAGNTASSNTYLRSTGAAGAATAPVWAAVASGDVTGALGYTPVNPTRQILAGTGLTGGGDLTADRTLALSTPVAVANGGTGQTTYTDGQLLIGNTTGNTLTKATLTAGALAGVTIADGAGSITLDTVQDIRTSAAPAWAGLALTGAQPASVGTTPGTAASALETSIGGTGGNTTIATTGVGGIGGALSWTGGTGGTAASAATASTGGKGGTLTLTGGAGGAATGTAGTNVGGAGGDIYLLPGPGGAASGGATNTAGAAGNILLAVTTGNVIRGMVGIGTNAPDELLTVAGVNAGDGAHIGNAHLGVWGVNTAYCVLVHNTVKANTGSYALLQGSGGDTYLNAATSQKIGFRINNVDKMTMDTNGQLGIGITTPGALLSLGSAAANTKIALYDNGTLFFGLGIGSSEFRLHLSANTNFFTFYDAPAGNALCQIRGNGSVVLGLQAALATTATNGFVYISSGAGTPTGVPTAFTGKIAMYYDTTANKIWFYNSAWRGVLVA